MCGMVGLIDQQNKSSMETLRLMADSQVHRGPDAEGYLFDTLPTYQVGLAHRRLSIIDISEHANQPMQFAHLAIIFNGEIYNYADIKRELVKAGYTFDTQGDTEVILKAFHHWGMQSVNHFRGMFSFCIYDKENKKIYLFRDRVGVKPLYFYADDSLFIFSSELKSLHHHPRFKKALCNNGLNSYLQYGYIKSPQTIFTNTWKVRPGHIVEYNIVNHAWTEKKYWDINSYYQLPKLKISEDDAAERLESILKESFLLRMVSDVPVGVLLSGGIDSSLVASVLQNNMSKPLDTFTMAFADQSYDESRYARNIANHLGTNHHEKICTAKDAESIVYKLPYMYDEPFADSSAIPTALISEFTRQKVKVILSGDGGDEMFCGYDSYWLNQQRFNAISKIPGKKLLNSALKLMPDPIMMLYRYHYDAYNRYLKLRSILQVNDLEDKYHVVTNIFTQFDLTKLMVNHQPFNAQTNVFNELHPYERMMLIDFNHYLPDDLMVKVDRATMHFSLEGREPLLDHAILEYAAQLPIELKFKKYLLKKILKKYLPESYFERKKHGFGVPVNAWLRKELRFLIDRYFNVTTLKKQNIFNAKYVNALTQSFLKNKTNDNRIWTLLMFQMWYEKYFNMCF